MMRTFDKIRLLGIVPVVTLEHAEDAAPVARALMEGGLPCIEVALRTDAAQDALQRLAVGFPDLMVGAGTVLRVEQAKMAVESGAKFVVSPGLNRRVVEHCVERGIPVLPGVATPTEIEVALDLGLEVVKLFPAEALGGAAYLKAIAAPYRSISFVPTGGIECSNMMSYLGFARTLAVGGSWMTTGEILRKKNMDEVRQLTANAVAQMLGFRIARRIQDPAQMEQVHAAFRLLGGILPLTPDSAGGEAAGSEPVTPDQCINVTTNFLDRAIAYLTRRGIRTVSEPAPETSGRPTAVKLDLQVAGYGIRLVGR